VTRSLVAFVALVTLIGCVGGRTIPGVEFDPSKLPLDVYLVCDFHEPVESGVDVRCSGTFGDPTCETSAGVGATCSAGVRTSVPIVGVVASTTYLDARISDEDGPSLSVKVCVIAGPFERCVVDDR